MNTSSHDNPEEARIIRYLLDGLPVSEAEKLEEHYLGEASFFDLVEHVEEMMIREYLGGKLSPADSFRFESKYFSSPIQHGKVDLVRQRREHARLSMAQRSRPSRSTWRLPAWLIQVPVYATPVLLGIGLWLAADNAHLRTQFAEASRKESEVRAKALIGSLARASAVAITLLPGLDKSLDRQQPRDIRTAPGVTEIRIVFELPGLKDNALLAVEFEHVEAMGRHPILMRGGIAPSGRTVVVVTNVDELPPGEYLAYVRKDSPGRRQTLQSYTFRIIHE